MSYIKYYKQTIYNTILINTIKYGFVLLEKLLILINLLVVNKKQLIFVQNLYLLYLTKFNDHIVELFVWMNIGTTHFICLSTFCTTMKKIISIKKQY